MTKSKNGNELYFEHSNIQDINFIFNKGYVNSCYPYPKSKMIIERVKKKKKYFI